MGLALLGVELDAEHVAVTDDRDQVVPAVLRHAERRARVAAGDLVGVDEVEIDPRLDLLEHRVRAGDHFLLCTDGLTNVLESRHLAAALARDKHPGAIAEELVAAALDRNTRDNVTALVVVLL